jgi:hypothetical protein
VLWHLSFGFFLQAARGIKSGVDSGALAVYVFSDMKRAVIDAGTPKIITDCLLHNLAP